MKRISELKLLTERLTELKNQIKTEGKELFSLATTDLFLEHPKLQSFSWTQYTPYWNDGDPCTFRVNAYPDINGVDEDDTYEAGAVPGYPTYESMKGVLDDIEELLDALPYEIMESIFGDHTKVTVSRDGKVETEEYDHD